MRRRGAIALINPMLLDVSRVAWPSA